jgi:hypothetical protein
MVAFFVRGYFSSPEGAIAFRLAVAARTAVPEAAVNKYGHALHGKNKIGPTKHSGSPPPANNSVLLKKDQQLIFSAPVPPGPNAGHYVGTLLFRKNVAHSGHDRTQTSTLAQRSMTKTRPPADTPIQHHN